MSTDLLILHRNPLEPFPFDRWLADHDGTVVLLAARDRIVAGREALPGPRLGNVLVELLDTLDGPDEPVLEAARRLIREHGLADVVAHHEGDTERAALLREEFGLAGARPADVAPFRDKALMKSLLTGAGVEVAQHVVPASVDDGLAFADRHGYPVVSKDRAGFNSIGLRILHDRAALAEQLAGRADVVDRRQLLVESFVPGRMCHVDGLVVDGRTVLVWPSQYQYDLASFGNDTGARIDLTLDPDDPLTPRLVDLTERALAALRPAGSGLTVHGFHAEIFHTPDDRLVVCEIAARPGGAKVREVIGTLFGINHGEYLTRAHAGLPLPLLAETLAGGPPPAPRCMSGQALMMKRPGEIASVPDAPQDPWVRHFWLYAAAGEVVPPAGGSSDFLLAAVAEGATRAQAERRLRRLGDRFVAATEIRPVAGDTEERAA